MASDWVPAVTAVSASLLGLGGLAFGWSNARSERQARLQLADSELRRQRRLAQDGREYESRKKVYEDVIHFLGLILLDLEYRVPSESRLVDSMLFRSRHASSQTEAYDTPIEAPDRGALLRLAAQVATFGSLEVSDDVERFVRHYYGGLYRLVPLQAALSKLTTDPIDNSESSVPDILLRVLQAADELEQINRTVRMETLEAVVSHTDPAEKNAPERWKQWEESYSLSERSSDELADQFGLLLMPGDHDSWKIESQSSWYEEDAARILDYASSFLGEARSLSDRGAWLLIDSFGNDRYATWQSEYMQGRNERLSRKLRYLLGRDYDEVEEHRNYLTALLREIQQQVRRELSPSL